MFLVQIHIARGLLRLRGRGLGRHTPSPRSTATGSSRTTSDNPVECVIEGIRSLQELWQDLQAKSQHVSQPQADGRGGGGLPGCVASATSASSSATSWCASTATSRASYRGACCAKCNASLRLRNLPCYAHNYQGFDNGAVLRALAQMDSTRQPQCHQPDR
jgi:hypothetical protein